MRKRLGDSKKLVAHGDTALGEAWARAIARRMGMLCLDTPDTLMRGLSMDSADELRAPCPEAHAEQCWNARDEAFTAEPELVAAVERDLVTLEQRGVDILRVSCVVTCARRLNDGIARGYTRFHLDIHAMERLVLDVRQREIGRAHV